MHDYIIDTYLCQFMFFNKVHLIKTSNTEGRSHLTITHLPTVQGILMKHPNYEDDLKSNMHVGQFSAMQ